MGIPVLREKHLNRQKGQRDAQDIETKSQPASKIFRKAGVTARDSFQSICQKVTKNGSALVDFAYGVLTAKTKVSLPTSYGKNREVIMFRGVEITMKDKIWAAEFLANRGFGRAEQVINVSGTIDHKSTDELKNEALQLLRKIAKVQDAVAGERLPEVVDIPVNAQDTAETEHGSIGPLSNP